jgi:hypothetical protein
MDEGNHAMTAESVTITLAVAMQALTRRNTPANRGADAPSSSVRSPQLASDDSSASPPKGSQTVDRWSGHTRRGHG